jgi:hypothetical protein
VCEPHKAVCCDTVGQVLNFVAEESGDSRETLVEIAKEHPDKVFSQVKKIHEGAMPRRHLVQLSDIDPRWFKKILVSTYEAAPADFENLLGLRGVGPKTLRALNLVSELLYGTEISMRDPARFSFAHGGKDGTPFPVDRETYDRTISVMKDLVNRSKAERTDKGHALKRLNRYELEIS